MVAAVALGLRVLYLWQLQASPLANLLVGDALAYVRWGQRLAGGDWIGSDVFYQAPLYPYFLGVIQALWRGDLASDLFIVRVVQIVLGTMGCVFLTLAGKAMFGKSAGVVAGLMLACYPAAIFFDGLIQKSALDLPLLCLALWLLVMGRQAATHSKMRTLSWWAAAGATLALLMLSRENALVFVAAAALWAMIPLQRLSNEHAADAASSNKHDWRLGITRTVVLLAALMLTLSPVIVRNKIVGGEFHLTTSQFGPNFYIGNHAGADGSYQPLRYGRGDAAYERTDAIEIAQERTGKTLSPGEVSSYWTGQVLAFMRDETAVFMKLMWRKTMLLFNAVEVTDTEGQYAYSDYASVLHWLQKWGMGLLLPLAAAGMVLRGREMKKMWLLPLCIGLYAASVIAFFVFARYRLPLVPLLMLPAAAGLVTLPEVFRERQTRRLSIAMCAGLIALAFASWPVVQINDQRAVSYASFARATAMTSLSQENVGKLGEPLPSEQVEVFYRKAIAYAPHYAAAHFNYGVLLLESGRTDEAIDAFEATLRLKPDLADAWNQLGLARLKNGELSGAVMAYQEAIGRQPRFAQAHNNLGVALARAGQLESAAIHYRQAITLDPAMKQAHNNLGTTLARLGNLFEAILCFEKALAIDPTYVDAQANLQKAKSMLNAQ